MLRMRRAVGGMVTGGVLLCLLLASACGTDQDARWSEPPEGSPLLPDLVPLPPADLHTKKIEGSWTVEFSSTVVNVGDGDFHVTAVQQLDDSWTITQDIEHDGGGADHVPTSADAVWGGDGHEHWHVRRYVTYDLFALDEDGAPTGEARTDHKVGFCIYDFERAEVDMGPEEAVYPREGCGEKSSSRLVMGLSPGWADYYNWSLPGQSIDIDGLGDREYRIVATADVAGVFREETTDNNATWVDFTLSTDDDGVRYAVIDEVGPSPE